MSSLAGLDPFSRSSPASTVVLPLFSVTGIFVFCYMCQFYCCIIVMWPAYLIRILAISCVELLGFPIIFLRLLIFFHSTLFLLSFEPCCSPHKRVVSCVFALSVPPSPGRVGRAGAEHVLNTFPFRLFSKFVCQSLQPQPFSRHAFLFIYDLASTLMNVYLP